MDDSYVKTLYGIIFKLNLDEEYVMTNDMQHFHMIIINRNTSLFNGFSLVNFIKVFDIIYYSY